jgi:hypothetical protein
MEALASVGTGTSFNSGVRGGSVGRLKLRLELLHFATATKKKNSRVQQRLSAFAAAAFATSKGAP